MRQYRFSAKAKQKMLEAMEPVRAIRQQPVRVVWPIPVWMWWVMRHRWPKRLQRHVGWALLVDEDGVYRVEVE
jgi:hypothetical protein